MLIGLAIGSTYKPKERQSQERQLIPQEVVTPVKKIGYVKDNYICASYGDIASSNFFWGFWEQAEEMGGDWTDLVYSGSGMQRITYAFPICYYSGWDYINYVDVSTWSQTPVYGFQMNWQRSADVTNHYNQRYRIVNIAVTAVDNNNNGVGVSVNFRIGIYCGYSNEPVGINIYNAGGDYSVQYTTDSNINNVIFLGLLSGSTSATDIAYEQGYNQGASDITNSNNGVFGLISQAFTSVASIFTINVLPGLTIGTLIVVPLIVMVIIVLFKLFRG